jgi:hypothetical protein
VSSLGVTYIRFSSNDTSGIQEAVNSKTIEIDTAAPITNVSATVNGTAYTFGTNTTLSVNVQLNCTDNASLCAQTYYCIDTNNSCNPYTGGITYPLSGIVVSAVGSNYVRYQSIDNAANLETTGNVSVMIAGVTTSTPIYAGWNLIGWTSPTSTTADAFGAMIGGDTVQTYDAVAQQWISRIVGIVGPNFAINQGSAVFVHSNVNSTWVH